MPGVSNDSLFEWNPITLVSMLSPNQHFEIAYQAYLHGQVLFMVGDTQEYSDLLSSAFKGLFASNDFHSLDAETQTQRQNMAIHLMTLLMNLGELDGTINDCIIKSVETKYNQTLTPNQYGSPEHGRI